MKVNIFSCDQVGLFRVSNGKLLDLAIRAAARVILLFALLVAFSASAAWQDTDKDGVPDKKDACPDSPANVVVMANGCQDPDDVALASALKQSAKQAVAQDALLDDNRPDQASSKMKSALANEIKQQVQACAEKAGLNSEEFTCLNNLLAPVYFGVGENKVSATQWPSLYKLLVVVESLPKGFSLSIEGHTDTSGSDSVNMNLSLARAVAVKNALMAEATSINFDKVNVVGLADKRSVASNDTAQGRLLNRRVEFVISAE
ncbi:OmpA family protein [Shewanella maritima]|uniref:OmpA family protein n=1 Tax=Shewanella maritima TaxID=2520507 RepID=A0A411PE73_9GAMM|nr:OmpA family protein [Shewanella maritima]QBF81835.1 OmpA family protein [Shewanella maritima]